MKTPEDQLDALILRYLEGALDEDARRELETRLRDGAVAERLALLASDQMALRRLLKSGAVAEDAVRIAREPGQQFPARLSQLQPRKRRWAAAGALAAAALLLIAAAFWTFRPGLRLEEGLVAVAGVETSRLREGERFTVVGDGPAVLRLGDGSRVQMDVGSKGVAHGRARGTRQLFELERGAGRFEVEKGMGVFRVETPSGDVTVLGTKFDVELRPGTKKGEDNMNGRTALTLVVAVVAGSVQVDWNGRTVKLSAGQQQAFAAEGSDRGVEGRRVQADGDKAKPSNKMVIVAVHKIVGGKAFLESFDGKTYEVVGKTAASLARMPKEILFLEATLVKEQPNGGTVELGVWGTSPLNKDAKKLQLKYLDQIIEKRKAMGLFINQKTYDKLKKEKKAMGL